MRKKRSLQQIREDRRLTQAAVAEKLGISREHVSRLENGKRKPTWNVLVPMARLYRVSAELLMSAAKVYEKTPLPQ